MNLNKCEQMRVLMRQHAARGVTTAPANPAMQGTRGLRGPKQAARKYFLHHKTVRALFQVFQEFVGTDLWGKSDPTNLHEGW